MHYLRLAAVLAGAWLAGSFLVMATSRIGVETAQDILQPQTEAAKLARDIDAGSLRLLLQHQGREVSRRLASAWELAQVGIGLALLGCVWLAAGRKRYSIVVGFLMLGCVVFLHWFITPEMRSLTPGADLVFDSEESLPRDRLRSLHTGYTIIDTVKMGLGAVLVFSLVKSRRRRRGEASENG